MKTLQLFIALALLTILPINAFATNDTDIIPPEILEQMDPDILSGARPTIYKLKQAEIFELRNNPKFNTDFVTFDFDPKKLPSTQFNILDNWIKLGTNKIYLKNKDIYKYAQIFPAGIQGITHKKRKGELVPCTLLQHPVNTDCEKIQINPTLIKDILKIQTLGIIFTLQNLPQNSISIINMDNAAIAGKLKSGNGAIYFQNTVTGTDARRWQLNYWHWALGLKIPGATETTISTASTLTFAEAKNYDTIELKNGDIITGNISNKNFTIKTSYATLTFDIDKFRQIQIEGNETKQDVLTLRIGDRISGVLQTTEIEIELASGAKTKIAKDKIHLIQMKKK
jgi:hypothetical protein